MGEPLEPGRGEPARLERTYSGYARSGRRRRQWAAGNPGNVEIRAELLAAVRQAIGGRLDRGDLLDIGCGGGWLLAELAGGGVEQTRLHGVELIEGRLAAARRRVPGADLRRADARRLPWERDRFQAVTLLTVLSSLPDAEAVRTVLGETKRVLGPGGVAIVYEPRWPNPFNRATRLVAASELDRALGPARAEAALTVVPPLARRLGRLAPALYPRLAALRPLLTHRLVVAQSERNTEATSAR